MTKMKCDANKWWLTAKKKNVFMILKNITTDAEKNDYTQISF